MLRKEESFFKFVVQRPKEKPLVFPEVNAREFTIGQGINCSYTLDSHLFADRHQLVQKIRGKSYLVVPSGISCEVTSRSSDQKISIEELIALGLIEQVDHGYAIPFQLGSIAILKIGDTTLGLECNRSQIKSKSEDLPWALRYSPLSRNDRIFLAILFMSLFTTFISIWQIKKIPFPQRNIEEMDKQYAKLILEAPVVSRELFQEPIKTETAQEEDPPTLSPEQKPKKTTPGAKGSGEGKGMNKGLLAHLENQGGAQGVLNSKELKNVLQGVGVLTTKRPAGLKIAGPVISYREASGVDDLVAGIAARSTGSGGGAGTGKSTTTVGNPFDVSGSGSQHHLRSYQEIDKVIRRHLEGIRFLYERYLRTNPLLQGRVTLKFTINAEGNVIQCSVASTTMKNKEFQEDLVKRVRLWKFPAINPSSGNVSVVYPFTFLPKRN